MKQLIRDLAGVACIAGFGGFIRTLVGKARHEPYNLKTGVTEVLIAVFAGFLAHWLGQEYIASDNLRTAAIALAGYSARGHHGNPRRRRDHQMQGAGAFLRACQSALLAAIIT